MDRRNAAQRAHRQIERAALPVELRLDRAWLSIDVGDDAQPIAFVKCTGLSRNVGGWVMQPEIRFDPAAYRLGDHLASAVLIEAVDHDPIEAGQSPHLARS